MPKTVVPSPKSLLDAELIRVGRKPRYGIGSGRHVGDCVKLGDNRTIARSGLYVFDVADERHIGQIEAINAGAAKVRWQPRLHSWVSLTELRLANKGDY